MTEKSMTQIIRELISANFPLEIIGQPRAMSQFGVAYTTFINGCAFNEGDSATHVLGAHDGQINTWAMEWISTLPKDHDVAVWRVFPEEQTVTINDPASLRFEYGRELTFDEITKLPPMQTVRRIRWRLHTMSRAQLIAHLDVMPALPQLVEQVSA